MKYHWEYPKLGDFTYNLLPQSQIKPFFFVNLGLYGEAVFDYKTAEENYKAAFEGDKKDSHLERIDSISRLK
jgi:hypothetical protein